MKKIYKKLLVFLISLILTVNVNAKQIFIDIEKDTISNNNKNYENIKTYESLDKFLKDYKSNKLPEIYITNFLFDGISAVKSPDLDDYIENNTNDINMKTLKIKVLNIKTAGNIELTGKMEGMIAINTNNIKENINIILNNVNIDTNSKKTPAIYIYNKDINYTDAMVTIKTKNNSKNYIEGGKFKKVSLIPLDELNNYKSYYSGNALINYEKYSSYYGIYTKDELDNILFATIKADYEDLKDGDPYLFYKGAGAISSDIDLYFEGEGYLKVTSKNKEGIETKGNLIFSGSTGDYEIYAHDDCLNTTTSNGKNDLIIDVNSLLAIVNDEGDEGDAIDSNGTLTINGGKIYAFAHSSSGDFGLDSENGTYINGGTIIATGNMSDMISSESKQKYIYVNLNSKIKSNTLIVIKDQDDNIITAFRTNKDISTLFYSSDNLNYESFKIYSGGNIEGREENGLYYDIESYNEGVEINYSNVSFNKINFKNKPNNFILNLLIVEIIGLVIVIIYAYYLYKRVCK